jgi:hypothetical protein
MATVALRRSPATGRMAVASLIWSGMVVLLTAMLGVVAATQLRLAAILLGEAWFGPSVRAWLR